MRNLHIVVATIGRPTCRSVVHDALLRERRLARLTIVAQGGAHILDLDLRELANREGVAIAEVMLPERVGPDRARHVGTAQGTEEFVGFLDDDIGFDSGSLSSLVERCERETVGAACGVLSVPETGFAASLLKAILFRSIFRDPRPLATRVRRRMRTNFLSGGMAVYRRDLYARSAPAWLDLGSDAWWGDAYVSYEASRHATLAVDPAARVRNRTREVSTGPPNATARALWRLDRYRTFAHLHASTRRHWAAYGGVLVCVLGRGVVEGACPEFLRAVLGEVVHTARQVGLRPAVQPRPSGLEHPAPSQRV
ncbi:MAG: glycosyltransferase [Acidimicrobiales bacterium]